LHAYQSLPAADAGVIGNLFESDGDRMAAEAERARALAELERLRTENAIRRQTAELDAERQRALLRAAGYHPAGADDGETAAETWILFIAAAGAVGMAAYWLRRSEAAEARIRQLTTRLEIAERAAWGENGRARMLLADRSAEHHQQGDRR
jgi:NADPH:quinone reductase-like Zn-dependent oxidoreductase